MWTRASRPILALVLGFVFVSGAMAMSSGGSSDSGDSGGNDASAYYEEGRGLIKINNFKGAIPKLLKAVKAESDNADARNLLGYAYRKTGDYENALKYYQAALELDPDHADAREYLGEAYLEMGDIPMAEQQLAELRRICPSGCEQLDELTEAVAAKKATN